jgi:hypothetical protein
MEERHESVFRYRLDFYYQQALIYLLTLVLYGGIKGSFVEERFVYVLSDPIVYIIIFFVVVAIVSLVLNFIRHRRLIIAHDTIVFKNRFRERRIHVKEIEWMHIGREAYVQTSGRFQVIVFKLRGKRRLLRIRVGRYEREKELVAEMNRLAAQVPKQRHRRWRRPRIIDR